MSKRGLAEIHGRGNIIVRQEMENGKPLTRRELQVLAEISRGLSNKETGLQLGIARGTVKIHISNINRKLGAHSRVELALILLEAQVGRALRDAFEIGLGCGILVGIAADLENASRTGMAYGRGYRDRLAERDLQWNHVLRESPGQGDETAPQRSTN